MCKKFFWIALILVLLFALNACASAKPDVSLVPTGHAPSPANAGYKNVTPKQALAMMKKEARLVDVRQPEEYQAGHIPGAELVPLDNIPAASQSWDKQKPVIVICLSGGRSAMAANYLVKQGFTKVYNFAGGMMAYKGPRVK